MEQQTDKNIEKRGVEKLWLNLLIGVLIVNIASVLFIGWLEFGKTNTQSLYVMGSINGLMTKIILWPFVACILFAIGRRFRNVHSQIKIFFFTSLIVFTDNLYLITLLCFSGVGFSGFSGVGPDKYL